MSAIRSLLGFGSSRQAALNLQRRQNTIQVPEGYQRLNSHADIAVYLFHQVHRRVLARGYADFLQQVGNVQQLDMDMVLDLAALCIRREVLSHRAVDRIAIRDKHLLALDKSTQFEFAIPKTILASFKSPKDFRKRLLTRLRPYDSYTSFECAEVYLQRVANLAPQYFDIRLTAIIYLSDAEHFHAQALLQPGGDIAYERADLPVPIKLCGIRQITSIERDTSAQSAKRVVIRLSFADTSGVAQSIGVDFRNVFLGDSFVNLLRGFVQLIVPRRVDALWGHAPWPESASGTGTPAVEPAESESASDQGESFVWPPPESEVEDSEPTSPLRAQAVIEHDEDQNDECVSGSQWQSENQFHIFYRGHLGSTGTAGAFGGRPISVKEVKTSMFEPRQNFLYEVLEHLEVGWLGQYLDRSRAHIDRSTVLAYAWQLATALSFVESRGFVHRNVHLGALRLSTASHLKLRDRSDSVDSRARFRQRSSSITKIISSDELAFQRSRSRSRGNSVSTSERSDSPASRVGAETSNASSLASSNPFELDEEEADGPTEEEADLDATLLFAPLSTETLEDGKTSPLAETTATTMSPELESIWAMEHTTADGEGETEQSRPETTDAAASDTTLMRHHFDHSRSASVDGEASGLFDLLSPSYTDDEEHEDEENEDRAELAALARAFFEAGDFDSNGQSPFLPPSNRASLGGLGEPILPPAAQLNPISPDGSADMELSQEPSEAPTPNAVHSIAESVAADTDETASVDDRGEVPESEEEGDLHSDATASEQDEVGLSESDDIAMEADGSSQVAPEELPADETEDESATSDPNSTPANRDDSAWDIDPLASETSSIHSTSPWNSARTSPEPQVEASDEHLQDSKVEDKPDALASDDLDATLVEPPSPVTLAANASSPQASLTEVAKDQMSSLEETEDGVTTVKLTELPQHAELPNGIGDAAPSQPVSEQQASTRDFGASRDTPNELLSQNSGSADADEILAQPGEAAEDGRGLSYSKAPVLEQHDSDTAPSMIPPLKGYAEVPEVHQPEAMPEPQAQLESEIDSEAPITTESQVEPQPEFKLKPTLSSPNSPLATPLPEDEKSCTQENTAVAGTRGEHAKFVQPTQALEAQHRHHAEAETAAPMAMHEAPTESNMPAENMVSPTGASSNKSPVASLTESSSPIPGHTDQSAATSGTQTQVAPAFLTAEETSKPPDLAALRRKKQALSQDKAAAQASAQRAAKTTRTKPSGDRLHRPATKPATTRPVSSATQKRRQQAAANRGAVPPKTGEAKSTTSTTTRKTVRSKIDTGLSRAASTRKAPSSKTSKAPKNTSKGTQAATSNSGKSATGSESKRTKSVRSTSRGAATPSKKVASATGSKKSGSAPKLPPRRVPTESVVPAVLLDLQARLKSMTAACTNLRGLALGSTKEETIWVLEQVLQVRADTYAVSLFRVFMSQGEFFQSTCSQVDTVAIQF
ncbi:uncharacterized protein MONBRDRAFT_5054 [Monosiga brevicollis MX1]|uniref:Serine-threonine/tyrosine-protein kinase catalytic domain-containing protein n=1 Tax=Monosiga brevicollis TaxID=81824 RepID=A9UPS2_MONBE|nr:uncharacterized protein MONBRDRAFT_5054 [Monosiga brevicollis MX1]EDQ92473.1 predicted protein [Monosiga brevicollis MX1]|eukprot:XP_001742235.1 hypothetical protein [Monosiga brevicollis MX1]